MFKNLLSTPKKKFLVFLGIIFLFVGALFFLKELSKRSKAAPGVPTLSYAVEPSPLADGQNFDLVLKVNPNGATFYAFELYTNYDSSKVGFQNSSSLASNISSSYILVNSSVDESAQKISIVGTRTGSAFTGNADIEIARVTMNVVSGASGNVNFNWDANTKLGSNIPKELVNGIFTIGGGGGGNFSPTPGGGNISPTPGGGIPSGPDFHINIPSIETFPGQTAFASPGQNLDTMVYLTTDGNDVKSVDFSMPYDDSVLTFQNTTSLDQNIVINSSSGFNTQFVIKRVDTTAKKIIFALTAPVSGSQPVPVNGDDILVATIKFKVRTDAQDGQQVEFLPDTTSRIYNLQTQNIISCTGGFRFTVGAGPVPSDTPEPGIPTDTPEPGIPTDTPEPGFPTDTPEPVPTDTPFVPYPTSPPVLPTQPHGVAIALDLKLRFQGILARPNRLQTIPVKVTVIKGNSTLTAQSQSMNVTSDESGIWSGQAYFPSLLEGQDYKILIKGPMHLQKRICDAGPSEAEPGKYSCITGTIPLVGGTNSLDFTGINLISGDLPNQDGVANAYDVALTRNNLGSTDPAVLAMADVNFDGIVDTQDHDLVIEALFIRTDDER